MWVGYMTHQGHLRDAQIEAIKTYLYLKIAYNCQSLKILFCQGAFNSLDLDELALSSGTREYLKSHKAAVAFLDYACLTNDADVQVSPKLEQQIKKDPESIHYQKFFRDAFYGVSYTDYLFSLPMGAGKTYLMAAFIYLGLYFASQEPNNPALAHNFIVFAPSGFLRLRQLGQLEGGAGDRQGLLLRVMIKFKFHCDSPLIYSILACDQAAFKGAFGMWTSFIS